MKDHISEERLYQLYLDFDRDFKRDHPEVVYAPPSFEGFQFTLARLNDHPQEKEKLIRWWKQGWKETSRQFHEKQADIIARMLNENKQIAEQAEKELKELCEEMESHLRYI